MKKIFILILNYNGYEDTHICLSTLKKLYDTKYHVEIVIIDNGSKQTQIDLLKNLLKKYPNIILLENGKNLGFAAGNNVGIRYALKKGADYVLLLNNDTKAEMNFLRNLLAIDAPVSSPIVTYQEFKGKKRLLYDLGGIVNWWTGRTTHVNVYQEGLKRYENEKPIRVDYVAGCCMLVKREVFESIGLLDENYFIYFEDVDFCVTAVKKSFQVIVDPNSFIYHKLGGSMDRWSKRAIFHNLFGNFIFITKHLDWCRITGYFYLSILTFKIVVDRIRKND